jgi:beta-phosphoglucomutase-like phosphatase (HAD superfamily)
MASTSPCVVIFDCDGTLLDTEPAYLEAESGIAATHGGVTLDQFKTVVPRLLGTVPADSARIVIDAFGLPLTPEQYLTERNSRTDSLFPQVRARPKVCPYKEADTLPAPL